MSRFDENTKNTSMIDENTGMMHERRKANLIDLHEPEPQTKARAIAMGILLGVIGWIAAIALGLAIWRWIAGSSTLAL
jgi:hypothetical protein